MASRRHGRGLHRERWHGFLFIAPAYVFLAGVILFPLGTAIWSSLLRIRGLNSSFVGLTNYARASHDPAFWNSFRVSLAFTSACVVIDMVIGFGIALLLTSLARGRGALQIGFLVPWMVAPAIGATIWLWLLDPQFGVVNWVLGALRLVNAPPIWLGEPSLALGSIIVVNVWRNMPFILLLLLAGLLTIPADQYEAAALDGATAGQKFRFVTLPNMRALLVVASTLDVINTVRAFDVVAVMTGGGPVNATEVLPALIYSTAFRANQLGQAAAIGVILLLLVLAFSTVYVGLTRPTADNS
jgi:multiple sugar transport system permease protein